jgi:hypothetical protein
MTTEVEQTVTFISILEYLVFEDSSSLDSDEDSNIIIRKLLESIFSVR